MALGTTQLSHSALSGFFFFFFGYFYKTRGREAASIRPAPL